MNTLGNRATIILLAVSAIAIVLGLVLMAVSGGNGGFGIL